MEPAKFSVFNCVQSALCLSKLSIIMLGLDFLGSSMEVWMLLSHQANFTMLSHQCGSKSFLWIQDELLYIKVQHQSASKNKTEGKILTEKYTFSNT